MLTKALIASCHLYTLFLPLLHTSPLRQENNRTANTAARVASLPKLPQTLNVVQHSGYLRGQTDNIQLYYWLVEAEHSPETAPLMLYLNGGPGCSSLRGLLASHGPFLVDKTSELKVNPYSWTKIANIIYLETPAGVGFSFAVDGNIRTDDDQMAVDNYYALVDFVTKFPKYRDRDFFIAGHSYAGVYIPLLALELMRRPSLFKLKGLVIGNGVMNKDMFLQAIYYFMFTRDLIDMEMWKALTDECCGSKPMEFCPKIDYENDRCSKIVNEVNKNVLHKISEYDIYALCDGGSTPNSMKEEMSLLLTNALALSEQPPCLSRKDTDAYLQEPEVRKALHVNMSILWTSCNYQLMRHLYVRRYVNMKSQVETILQKGVPIILFNGDTDMLVPPIATEWFVKSLNAMTVNPYRPWLYKEIDGTLQVGGYRKILSVAGTKLTRATVRGAGHDVTLRKPAASLHLMRVFIENGYIP